MDELDRAIARAAAFQKEQNRAAGVELEESTEQGASSVTISAPSSLDQAKNMAESLLKTGEQITKILVDKRLIVDQEEVDDCRESMAPLLDKYKVSSGGSVPFIEEIRGGYYMGGLFKRFKRAVAELKAQDKKKREQQENGSTRANREEKQARNVSGQVGIREESNAKAEGWDSENWAGGVMGSEQGSPRA